MIIDNAKNETSMGYAPGFSGDGFISLFIVYGVAAVTTWLASSILLILGEKLSLAIGSFSIALFTASFLYLDTALLYSASAVLGVGWTLGWSAQVMGVMRRLSRKDMEWP